MDKIIEVFRGGKYVYMDFDNYKLLIVKRKSIILLVAIVDEAAGTIDKMLINSGIAKKSKIADFGNAKDIVRIYEMCIEFEAVDRSDVKSIALEI
ncbi:hypothetical protein [Butyrivibrio sp. AE3006]|uniref:hypothetical protein n=1 Tax=Butyrivibrio sp. AE3006 TaxID=1280673 RepID=UPI00041985D5|nr:hypothetical protein [Butyrivibrio sp. AE3006]